MLRIVFSIGLAGLAGLAAAPAAADQAAIARGADVFRACAACHQLGPDAGPDVGPHLNGLFGRRAGALEGFAFSGEMRRMGVDGLVWDRETLDLYLETPKALVSRPHMTFPGLADEARRADVIAYLRSFSDNPADIPESAPTEAARDPGVDPAVLAIAGDPDYGEYLSGECVTCHRADGEYEGIPSIIGWPAEDFALALHAYRSGLRDNPAMKLVAARLSDEEIAGLAAYFEQAEY